MNPPKIDPRILLRQLADAVADVVESKEDAARWYHQDNSPLPKSSYLRLVHAGHVEGFKIGMGVLVRRADLDAFIERHRIERGAEPAPLPADDADDFDQGKAVDGLLAELGMRRKAG